MTTVAEINESHRLAPGHRFGLRGLLKVRFAAATEADVPVIEALDAVTSPAEYDAMLAKPQVTSLFHRGVLYFGGAK